jgi:hypothetical protein
VTDNVFKVSLDDDSKIAGRPTQHHFNNEIQINAILCPTSVAGIVIAVYCLAGNCPIHAAG